MAEALEILREKLVKLQCDNMLEEEESKNLLEILDLSKAALLKNSSLRKHKKRNQELLLRVRDIVYDIDDIIDSYVEYYFATKKSSLSYFNKAFNLRPVRLKISVHEKLHSLQDMIKRDTDDMASFADVEHRKSPLQLPPIRDSPVVGLKHEEEEIKQYLMENSEELDLISIVGMPGIGKTALAWKIFNSEDAMYEFPTRVWVNVSNEFSEKEVFLTVLKHFTSLTDDIIGREENELAQLVAKNIEGKRFLIVMDDVVTPHALKRLQVALPKHNKMGKVLITSRDANVVRGWRASSSRPAAVVRLRFLTRDESWSLLQSEVFGDGECPPQLESIGTLIADQCDGLPLAICAIAAAISKVDLSSSDMWERRSGWTRLCSRVPQYINNVFYLDLPEHLRVCFLYLGMFPPDFEIPVWKLTRMWITEGFIKTKNDDGVDQNLEITAESYVEDLVSRNLVVADRIKSNGKLKTCRIHPVLHEYCRSENESENFIKQIEFADGTFNPPPTSDLSNYRRLCIHSNLFDFLRCKPSAPHVRSFVSFARDEVHLTSENSSAIPAGFKRLRVLDVPIQFTKIPRDMYQLFQLRFLVLSFESAILPATLSKLSNIQTLILNTKSRTLDIKANIWQLTQLRHLKTNVSATLTTTGSHTSGSKEGENLQTLAMVSPGSCTDELFARARELKKLGIRGKLAMFFKGKVGSSHRLGELSHLQSLKLVNDVFPLPPSTGGLHDLPSPDSFPPNLRSLTLVNTWLEWKHMPTLALLKGLEVLKLKDNAFLGSSWSTENGGFDSLEALHIGDTDLVDWVVSTDHFPKLKSLKLHNCVKLQEVPIQLAYKPYFQRLELYSTNLAAPSAIRIRDEIKNEQGASNKGREFMLSIYPPIE